MSLIVDDVDACSSIFCMYFPDIIVCQSNLWEISVVSKLINVFPSYFMLFSQREFMMLVLIEVSLSIMPLEAFYDKYTTKTLERQAKLHPNMCLILCLPAFNNLRLEQTAVRQAVRQCTTAC